MKKNRSKFVTISALALSAACHAPAWAQIVITCGQVLDIGELVACGSGTLTIHPDGSTTPGGCIVVNAPPNPAHCIISTGGVLPTRNVVVKFTSPSMTIKDGGGGKATINFLKMLPSGATIPKAQFTFTPTEVGNGIHLDIGGRLDFTTGQALGAYSGTVSITADLQ